MEVMFKLESYVVPILMNYVNKYITNFKAEDSQVSLWDGDASFHSLELRLDVLEQELQSPFSFVSGHIQELLIHVPWTKLTSAPIVVTINTIECVLKLKNSTEPPVVNAKKRFSPNKQDIETPPSYIKLLINKIVANIQIVCNNLILKYVEDDVVLSLNVKHLKLESANNKWLPAFIDVITSDAVMRKIIIISDLTVCLDKRGVSGKIDVYQEPILYKSSMNIHFLRFYQSSNTPQKECLTRVDIHCSQMEFSLSEIQLTMIIKILLLLYNMKARNLTNNQNVTYSNDDKTIEQNEKQVTWSTWAWSFVRSVVPGQWDPINPDEDLNNMIDSSKQTFHIGFYIDHISITFKTSEIGTEKRYYKHKKTIYTPLLLLKLHGLYYEFHLYSSKWTNIVLGISQILFFPIGKCLCGYNETEASHQSDCYLQIGNNECNHYLETSLFDPTTEEKSYNSMKSWENYFEMNTEEILLTRSPALCLDFIFEEVVTSEDDEFEFISEEKSSIRLYIGSGNYIISSGLYHRLKYIFNVVSTQDLPLQNLKIPEITYKDLSPPLADDFEQFNNYIGLQTIKIVLCRPTIYICSQDHALQTTVKDSMKIKLNRLTIDLVQPLHIDPLVFIACQIPTAPQHMLDACYKKITINISEFSVNMLLNSISNSIPLVGPFNASISYDTILRPNLWLEPFMNCTNIKFETEKIALNGYTTDILTGMELIEKLIDCYLRNDRYPNVHLDNTLNCGIQCRFLMNNIRFYYITTKTVYSLKFFCEKIIATCIEDNCQHLPKTVLIAPAQLLEITFQTNLELNEDLKPSIILLKLRDLTICLDPLLIKWIFSLSSGIDKKDIEEHFIQDKCTKLYKTEKGSEPEVKTFTNKRQSQSNICKNEENKIMYLKSKWLKTLLIVNIEIECCTINFPVTTNEDIHSINDELLVLQLPEFSISTPTKYDLKKYCSSIPIQFPHLVDDTEMNESLWIIKANNFHAYTSVNGNEVNSLELFSINTTIAYSMKVQEVNEGKHINPEICIHTDVTPILITLHSSQVNTFINALNGLATLYSIIYIGSRENVDFKTNSIESNLSVWFQWTVPKIIMKLIHNNNLQLLLESEDIMGSLDLQQFYRKIKIKIALLNIQHFYWSENHWKIGDFSGFVLKQRECLLDFLDLTITSANTQHTHNLWGTDDIETVDSHSFLRKHGTKQCLSEIIINIRPIDLIMVPNIILKFYSLIVPFTKLQFGLHSTTNSNSKQKTINNCNRSLPLIYMNCGELQIIIPTDESINNHCCVSLKIKVIQLNSVATNPICRIPLRPDLYQFAASSHILNVPGSEIEDRQYQLDINDISIATSSWQIFEDDLNPQKDKFNENPALEWNNLIKYQEPIKPLSLYRPMLDKLDIVIIAAPLMVYNGIPICGSSYEINAVSDLNIDCSLDQLRLLTILLSQCYANLSTSNVKTNQEDYHKKIVQDFHSELARDSGFDSAELSSTSHTQISSDLDMKTVVSTTNNSLSSSIPAEILLTSGKISCLLYKQIATKIPNDGDQFAPLVCVTFVQSNIYVYMENNTRRAQASYFDMSIKISSIDNELLTTFPTCEDFKITILETRSGIPHPISGVLPAFVTVKYQADPPGFNIELARPTKFYYTLPNWIYLINIYQIICEMTVPSHDNGLNSKSDENTGLVQYLQQVKFVNLKVEQVVLSIRNDDKALEMNLSINKIASHLSCTSKECVQITTHFDSITVSIKNNEFNSKLILQPWSCDLKLIIMLMDQQRFKIKTFVNSDDFELHLNTKVIFLIQELLTDVQQGFTLNNIEQKANNKPIDNVEDRKQYYKDDLRAGAFQYINATNRRDLPLSYQILFWETQMTWKYPQPRYLTKLQVFPLPIANESIECDLDYWSNTKNEFIPFLRFSLVTNAIYTKYFKDKTAKQIWRLRIQSKHYKLLNAKDLVCSVRINSCLDPYAIPNFVFNLTMRQVNVILFTYFPNNCDYKIQNDELIGYSPNLQLLSQFQYFLKLILTNTVLSLSTWYYNNNLKSGIQIDFVNNFQCFVVDYMFLMQMRFLDATEFRLITCIRDNSFEMNASMSTFQMNIDPNLAHTLAVSCNLSVQNLQVEKERNLVLLTRLVICNKTPLDLCFGQSDTDEEILLTTKQFCVYFWKSTQHKQRFTLSTADGNCNFKSTFQPDNDGTFSVQISDEIHCIITISSLNTTQKLIVISGNLHISNMLCEDLEIRVLKENCELRLASSYCVPRRTVDFSLFNYGNSSKCYLRLRFFGLDSAWSGHIPLKEHSNPVQPWLVKIPLQDRGTFQSVWCRFLIEATDLNHYANLAMIWPLYSIRSNLPMPCNVFIDTRSLNSQQTVIVTGQGVVNQLNCPGTLDDCHQLTFSSTNDNRQVPGAYVPLNYNLATKDFFFKKTTEDTINNILNTVRKTYITNWPYFENKSQKINWIHDDEQPLTTVQIRYTKSCKYSCSLVVELLPWCLITNSLLTRKISFISNGMEFCQILPTGIIAPPKFDEPFKIGIQNEDDTWYFSTDLIFVEKPEERTRKEAILVPLDCNITVAIPVQNRTIVLSIQSSFTNEIRLLNLSSKYCLINKLVEGLYVSCIVVDLQKNYLNLTNLTCKNMFMKCPFFTSSYTGMQLTQWYTVDDTNLNCTDQLAFYLLISLNLEWGWSQPIHLLGSTNRFSFTIPTEVKNVPAALNIEEYNSVYYLAINYDKNPQFLIENHSNINLQYAQWCDKKIVTTHPENVHFTLSHQIEQINDGALKYYNLPLGFGENSLFSDHNNDEFIVFRKSNENDWSLPVNTKILDVQQTITIPNSNQIQIIIRNTAQTKIISIYSSISSTSATLFENSKCLEINLYLETFTLIFTNDFDESLIQEGIIGLSCEHTMFSLNQKRFQDITCKLSIANLQLDNLLYNQESYDFPVALINKQQFEVNTNGTIENIRKTLNQNGNNFVVSMVLESWSHPLNNTINFYGAREVQICFKPVSLFLEDTYASRILKYIKKLNILQLLVGIDYYETKTDKYRFINEEIHWLLEQNSYPLRVGHLVIEGISVLLSVHCSIKLYIALDQSPMEFKRFERRCLLVTPYRLGHLLTVHYLSGALFGVGWAVTSLELLGSPSGFARTMTLGLHDFIRMPYRGLIEGPGSFLAGVTQGSTSLMRHFTAGTLQSMTKLASSIARNLDKLTLDKEHIKRTQEQRRQRPQDLTDGIVQGLTTLGISILGAVGGIAHHPLQSLISNRVSMRSLVAGVGLGLIGIVTKPLSGAAEFLALTGQGILHGAGWDFLPTPRIHKYNNFLICKNELDAIQRNLNTISLYYAINALDLNTNQTITILLTDDYKLIVTNDENTLYDEFSLDNLHLIENDPESNEIGFIVRNPDEINNDDLDERNSVYKARVAAFIFNTYPTMDTSIVTQNFFDDFNTIDKTSCQYRFMLKNKKQFIFFIISLKAHKYNYIFPTF